MNTQKTFIQNGINVLQLEIPNENEFVMPDVKWGKAIAFPTVAYWYYKLICNQLTDQSMKYRLGNSLLEELGACLLGGHGIPAPIGNAAFDHIRSKGAFSGETHSFEKLYEWLSEPIFNGKKYVKYRFARQKASYLHHAIIAFNNEQPPIETGRVLRNWLTKIKGVGLKTASWVARNWLDADDVAILDIHIYRAGLLGGFFDDNLKVEKDYLKMEEIFVNLAKGMGVKASELDALIWFEMQQSPNIQMLLESRRDKSSFSLSTRFANKRHSNTNQLSLV